MSDLQVVQQLCRPVARGVGVCPCKLQHERDIFGRVEERDQVVELEDEADLVEPQPAQVGAQPPATVEDALAVEVQRAG